MSSARPFPISRWAAGSPPTDLAILVAWFEGQDEAHERFRWVLRDSLDELLDGERTGRWCYQHLGKTEKTHLGTAIEINLTKEFEIPAGLDIDWHVAGHDLDCKFSKDIGGWEIPMEMYLCPDHGELSGKADHPALLLWMNDDKGLWAAGLVRVTDDILRWKVGSDGVRRRAYNRDNKRTIAAGHLDQIYWLWSGVQEDLPANTLLGIDERTRRSILDPTLSGQGRVSRMFRELEGTYITRSVVLTVGQQDDAPKRARDARKDRVNRSMGLIILGHQNASPVIAERFDLPAPEKGEWVPVRVVPVDPSSTRPHFTFEETCWARALPDEPDHPGPLIPDKMIPGL